MKRMLIIEFTKMNGAGNDFIVLDNRFYQFSVSELSNLAQQICERRTSIGADGILALAPATIPEMDYRMIYINADGSEGTMCGNGARCLARFARASGVDKPVATMQTASGGCEVHAPFDAPVRVYLHPPTKVDHSIQLKTPHPDWISSVHFLRPGTEHLVCFTEDLCEVPVETWGKKLRDDPALAPTGANINFVNLNTDAPAACLHIRTYEKGVEAETLACGTGAVASVVAAQNAGWIASDACDVHMPGGILTVGLEKDRIYLEGPTEIAYRGSIELPIP